MSVELLKNSVKQYTETASFSMTSEEILESIVPDIYPDIATIITYSANVRIKEKYAQENAVTVSGEVCVRIFLCDENGKMFCLDGVIPFSRTKPVQGCKAGDITVLGSAIEKISADAINPRKIGVKAILCVEAKVYSAKQTEYCGDMEKDASDKLSQRAEHTHDKSRHRNRNFADCRQRKAVGRPC